MARRDVELFQLRCFVTVAEELNFRRAAERLHMTQPPLSRQIRNLEDGIGLTLLERSNRTVRLTPAGESFRASAIALLQRVEHAVLEARQAQRGESGSIALGFVPSAALEFVPRILSAFREHLPHATLNPVEMMSYEIVEAQRSGRLDLGLTRMERARPGIERVRAVSEGFTLAVPVAHPLADAPAPTLADLDGEPFVAYSTERGGFVSETHQAMFSSAGIAPRIVQEASQTHTVLGMVHRGIGLALVPASSTVVRMDGIRYRDIELPPQYRSDLYLVSPAHRRTPLQERVRTLILDVLAEFND